MSRVVPLSPILAADQANDANAEATNLVSQVLDTGRTTQGLPTPPTPDSDGPKDSHGPWSPGLVRHVGAALVRSKWGKYGPFIDCSEEEYKSKMACHGNSKVLLIIYNTLHITTCLFDNRVGCRTWNYKHWLRGWESPSSTWRFTRSEKMSCDSTNEGISSPTRRR